MLVRPRVLVIDDDDALRIALCDMLAFHFPTVEITVVASGSAAIAAAREKAFDLALCDLIMPGMNGQATVKGLREVQPHLLIYLVTGHPEPEKVYKDAAASGFIKKPLERLDFLALMRRTLHVIAVRTRAQATITATAEYLRRAKARQNDLGETGTETGK